MYRTTRFCLVSLLAALPAVATAAGKYTWFDEPGSATWRAPALGMELYRSVDDADAPVDVTPERASAEYKISLYGDYAARAPGLADDDGSSRRFANNMNVWGVRWQHRVSSQDRLSVSAQQGERSLSHPALVVNPDSLDTRATISWTRDLGLAWKPSITGGVFLGDETPRDDSLHNVGRRYYGFSVGGELRVLQSHTPYVSFRMQRSIYDVSGSDDNSSAMRATEDNSRFAAGWRWRASRGLSLQAEASYGLNFNPGSDPQLQDRDRSRLYFGTRFDFR